MRAARLLAWPMRSISSLRLVPASATRLFPACLRSWKCTPVRPVAVTAGIQTRLRKALWQMAHLGLVTPALRTAAGHFRWDLDDLRGQLRAMDPNAPQHDSAKPEPQRVVAAIVTSELGALSAGAMTAKPPWTFIAGEIEPGEYPADAGVPEVKEETGLLVAAGPEIGRRVHPATGRTMIYMAAKPTHGTDIFVGERKRVGRGSNGLTSPRQSSS